MDALNNQSRGDLGLALFPTYPLVASFFLHPRDSGHHVSHQHFLFCHVCPVSPSRLHASTMAS
jgi:hypothetical protein